MTSPVRRSGAGTWATRATATTSSSTRSTSRGECATGASPRARPISVSRSPTSRPGPRPGPKPTPPISSRSSKATLAAKDAGAVVALYDTELFGHWWYEGPEWLYRVIKKLQASPVRPETAGGALEALPPSAAIALPEGSWGKGGFHWIWLNEDTAWIWKKIYRIEAAAAALAPRLAGLDRRLLKQFFREKYLLESSDWPFLISTWSARDYAENRAAEHYERALTLVGWLEAGRALGPAEVSLLEVFESEDRIFEEVVLPDGTVI